MSYAITGMNLSLQELSRGQKEIAEVQVELLKCIKDQFGIIEILHKTIASLDHRIAELEKNKNV